MDVLNTRLLKVPFKVVSVIQTFIIQIPTVVCKTRSVLTDAYDIQESLTLKNQNTVII